MQITKDFLLSEIKNMERQRDHAHDVAVAAQASIDTMQSLIARLDASEEELKLSDISLVETEK